MVGANPVITRPIKGSKLHHREHQSDGEGSEALQEATSPSVALQDLPRFWETPSQCLGLRARLRCHARRAAAPGITATRPTPRQSPGPLLRAATWERR